ncbi:hypothetical protein BFJ68_g1328 [Fusarium oxysporum]|uniref:Uncharacterized protein n=1 Tax=Fusarium oxysporum TaxID=5507 RepID=A0A420S1H1_FUSOX|nr:hypothetical protein BFJ67_g11178 [Fusarium oxysporum f. sp. cepae]RKL23122.1 hypothetical protein BFJ68_g1328 [Fusarium oxysporum]
MRKKGRRQTKSPSLLNYLAGIGGGEGDEYENEELNNSSNPRKLKPEGDIGSLSGNLSNDSEDYHDSAGGHITSNARRLRRRVQGTSLAFHDPPPDTKLGEQQPEGGVSENVSGHLPTNDEEVDEESLLLRREQLRRLQKTQRRALSF